MKSATIIIPHIDDDLYSCWSVLADKSYDEITIVKCTKGAHQSARKPLHERLQSNPEEYSVNLNIKIIWLFGSEESTPEDGHLNEVSEVAIITALDKVVMQSQDLFYPSYSHHQDHAYLNSACKAALRPRSTNKVIRAFEYTYMYNHSTEKAVVYKPMTSESLCNKLKILKELNEHDPILVSGSVNSLEYVERMNRNFGAECGRIAAEKFILFFEVI